MHGVVPRIVLAFALLGLPATALAQPFPSGPISIVVPLAPGDAADITARVTNRSGEPPLNAPASDRSSMGVNRLPGAIAKMGSHAIGCALALNASKPRKL